MTNKVKTKATRPAARKPVTAKSEAVRIAAENARLLERLAAAEERIVQLESQRDDALNRIEWVIDSINSLTDGVR
jgi:hypothetical protein